MDKKLSKEKSELIAKLKEKCHDFLNYENPQTINDVYYEGFYIEVEDVADMFLEMGLKK